LLLGTTACGGTVLVPPPPPSVAAAVSRFNIWRHGYGLPPVVEQADASTIPLGFLDGTFVFTELPDYTSVNKRPLTGCSFTMINPATGEAVAGLRCGSLGHRRANHCDCGVLKRKENGKTRGTICKNADCPKCHVEVVANLIDPASGTYAWWQVTMAKKGGNLAGYMWLSFANYFKFDCFATDYDVTKEVGPIGGGEHMHNQCRIPLNTSIPRFKEKFSKAIKTMLAIPADQHRHYVVCIQLLAHASDVKLFTCMTEPKTVTQRIIYIVMFGDNGKI
jgi:hypothetical protein